MSTLESHLYCIFLRISNKIDCVLKVKTYFRFTYTHTTFIKMLNGILDHGRSYDQSGSRMH